MSRIVTVARCYSRGKGDAPTPSPAQFRAVLLVLEVGVVLCSASLRPQQLLAQHGAQPSKVVWYPEVPVLFLVAFAITLHLPGYPTGVCVLIFLSVRGCRKSVLIHFLCVHMHTHTMCWFCFFFSAFFISSLAELKIHTQLLMSKEGLWQGYTRLLFLKHF